MKNKVILVILDGLNADTAATCMGYLAALIERGRGAYYTLACELPSMSRPLYECILTGVAPCDSGIYHNDVNRLSTQNSIFHYAKAAGLTTAAAAYHWVSELYNRTPFVPATDRHTVQADLPIQYAHFYYADHYPDSHLFDDAEHLRQTYQPDFLLVHSMNIDDAGHRAGVDSSHYRNTTRKADMYLSRYLQAWLDDGYQICITADHGMNDDNSHGGTLPSERLVPLYVFGNSFSGQSDVDIRQTQLCGTICTLLGASHDKSICKDLLR
ncbi:MAG: alkaline phosphatase family protein [Moraxella sp.]|nr:alkaline phosphatase family protein [Moraxella sp.]